MYRKQPRTNLLTTCLASLLYLFASGLPMRVLGEETTPSVEPGPPERTEPGGVRDDCLLGEKPLTALIPVTQKKVALTAAKYPTFFFYIPQNAAQRAEFVLIDEKQREYKTDVGIANTSGVVRVSIPDGSNLPGLGVGKSYHWKFSLVCKSGDKTKNRVVDGWVQRVQLRPEVVKKLENATDRDRVDLYAEAGVWHEALATLAELRYNNPNDTTLADKWIYLLKSVGLDAIAREQIVHMNSLTRF